MDSTTLERWLKAILYRGSLRPVRSTKNNSIASTPEAQTTTANEPTTQAKWAAPDSRNSRAEEEQSLPQRPFNRAPESYEQEEDYRETVAQLSIEPKPVSNRNP